MGTKTKNTWLHKNQLDKCCDKSIKMTSSSKQNRQKIKNTERKKQDF